MFTLQTLVDTDTQHWIELYPRAVAAGCGCVLASAEERIAACDELVALSVSELASLHTWATVAQLAPDPSEYTGPLASHAAAVIRLLDSALAAHGRDHGYAVDAWRERAVSAAASSGDVFGSLDAQDWPLCAALQRAAARIGRVLLVLPRDRLAVPEALADALGPLLAVYAAAADSRP